MTTPLVTRVLLADDHPVVRNGLRELLNSVDLTRYAIRRGLITP